MHPDQAIVRLIELREDIEDASEDFDWELVTTIDQEVRKLATAFPRESRTPALAREMSTLKACYERIFADSKLRKKELRKELGKMRDKREALDGYKNSLAAGNREIRKSA